MSAPLALTCGDPSGVGPEITHAAWSTLKDNHPFFVIGDPAHFEGGQVIERPDQAADVFTQALPVLPHAFSAPVKPGQPQQENAADVIAVIARAVELAQSGAASAVVTNPINKQVLIEGAGFEHPGHTEFLAALDGKERSVMMLAGPDLRVVPVTIHIALDQVPGALTAELINETIQTTHAALIRDFGVEHPRIAVAGLNPHAGEGGLMGLQEHELIRPVLDQLRGQGLDIKGPLPADTMFHAPARARYDVAICMYHDQALIPIKTLAFDEGVNVTLGLSFIRTSPDHGTAFDIAGQGFARPDSLIHAIKTAAELADNRARYDTRMP